MCVLRGADVLTEYVYEGGGGGGLPTDTQSVLLAPLRATITIMNELCRQRSKLINAWLSSYCCLVSFVARFCCQR